MIGPSMDLSGVRPETFPSLNNPQFPGIRHCAVYRHELRLPPVVKQERMDDENDSEMVSGDFHSSSSGNNVVQEWNSQLNPNAYLSQAQCNVATNESKLTPEVFNSLNQNPLTPPDSITDRPPSEIDGNELNNSNAMPSPPRENIDENQDHIKCLEMVNQSLAPTKEEEQALQPPIIDGVMRFKATRAKSGKGRSHRCKFCDNLLGSKDALWLHHRTHIPAAKQLRCTYDCYFVTDLKHHLEYHIRKHTGLKPFKCALCDYCCSTKSMLTSHEKSHTTIYQYRCRDCSYATKYCHSLKTHLRKLDHKPDIVLDEKGMPCPEIQIDVYGKRRGPKRKPKIGPKVEEPGALPAQPFDFARFMPAPPDLESMAQFWRLQALLAVAASASGGSVTTGPSFPMLPQPQPQQQPQEEVLDLSIHTAEADLWPKPCHKLPKPCHKLRRSSALLNGQNDYSQDATCTTMFSNVEAVVQAPESPEKAGSVSFNEKPEGEQKCRFCDMTFGNNTLYHLHMSYHGSRNPFTCNLCREECGDILTFNMHIMRVAH